MSIFWEWQYLQLQPGGRLPPHSVQQGAPQPLRTVRGVASWSEPDEALQILPRKEMRRGESHLTAGYTLIRDLCLP